ncbi:unnamed protein product [Calypogeia fissa]
MAKKKNGDRSAEPAGKKGNRLQTFAEKLRDHKELASRWAVLHQARVEYFRGKDFTALLRSHPDLKKVLVDAGELGLDEDDEEEAVGNLLLERKLVVRCDRVVKTVRPGKKKLSKWPARIELCPDQSFSEDDAFFAWTFEKRRPLWQTILSFLLPVITLACCLFPIFPHWWKLSVLYLCLTLLGLIVGLFFVRWVVFATLWILFGWRFWFFPNILAEEATFTELFQFWPEKRNEDEPPVKKTTRLAFSVLAALIVWVCIHHAPDEASRTRYQKKVSNIIDEVLVWKPSFAALNGYSKEATIILNDTLLNRTSVDSDSSVSESARSEAQDFVDGETVDRVDGGTQSAGCSEDQLMENTSTCQVSSSDVNNVDNVHEEI